MDYLDAIVDTIYRVPMDATASLLFCDREKEYIFYYHISYVNAGRKINRITNIFAKGKDDGRFKQLDVSSIVSNETMYDLKRDLIYKEEDESELHTQIDEYCRLYKVFKDINFKALDELTVKERFDLIQLYTHFIYIVHPLAFRRVYGDIAPDFISYIMEVVRD